MRVCSTLGVSAFILPAKITSAGRLWSSMPLLTRSLALTLLRRRVPSRHRLPCGQRRLLSTALMAQEVSDDGLTEISGDPLGDVLERTGAQEATTARTILLNRPKALNALNTSMCRKIRARVAVMENSSESARTLILRSTSTRAFCSGGDVRAVAMAAKDKDWASGEELFRAEYTMNYALATARKCQLVAFMDGITMGGGAGLSVHCPFRVATERTLFAMPECSIGFTPDVGMTYVLSRLNRNFGCYMALTGARLKGPAVVAAGLATHYVPSHRLDDLESVLSEIQPPPWRAGHEEFFAREIKQSLLDASDRSAGLEEYPGLRVVEDCFGADSLDEILQRLYRVEREGDDEANVAFARDTLDTLRSMSPFSLKVTFEALRRARDRSLKDCLRTEYRLACQFIRTADFYEGIRAVLIDKDHKPHWSVSSVDDVGDVSAYFELPAGVQELNLDNVFAVLPSKI